MRNHKPERIWIVLTATILGLFISACAQNPLQITQHVQRVQPYPAPVTVVTGSGDFPRMYFVAPASDGKTAALYLVEKDTATQVAIFKGRWMGRRVTSKLSPDGRYLAVLFPYDQVLDSFLEIVDLENGSVTPLIQVVGDALPEVKDSGLQAVTSFVWVDDQHLLYSKVMLPGSGELPNVAEGGGPLPIQGEIWQTNLNGTEQSLLMTSHFNRLLGISNDGSRYFVTGLIEWSWKIEDFYDLDAESGVLESVWGAEGKPGRYSYGLSQATLPDGSLRLFIACSDEAPGRTVFGKIPNFWMIDPETGNKQIVWIGDQHPETEGLYLPEDMVWSSFSMDEYLYTLGAQLWKTNIQSGEDIHLGEARGELIDWTDGEIVVWNIMTGSLQLLDRAGSVLGEIRFVDQYP